VHLPLASQVLLRRDGYREFLHLWQQFHQARRPLFAALQAAIDLRDVAALYEFWTFFALVEEIQAQTKEQTAIDLQLTDEQGLCWQSEARFGTAGTLIYNQSFSKRSYSVPLRPDFAWWHGETLRAVFDAKFRLEHLVQEGMSEDESPRALVQRTDLYKMHTYRDALGVSAVIAVYPGTESMFYHRTRQKHEFSCLQPILSGEWEGIGALAMRPGALEPKSSIDGQ